MVKWYFDFKEWMYYNGPIKGIRNLIIFFKAVWRHRSFDFSSFGFSLLYISLKEHYNNFTSPKCAIAWENKDKSLRALKLCILILERIKDDWYLDTWENDDMELISTSVTPHNEGDVQLYEIDFKYKNEQAAKRIINARNVEDRDRKLLWTLIQQYEGSWWW